MRNTIRIGSVELRPVPTQRLNIQKDMILIRRGMYYKVFKSEKCAKKFQDSCYTPVVYRVVKLENKQFNLCPVDWFDNHRGYLGYDFEPIKGEIL